MPPATTESSQASLAQIRELYARSVVEMLQQRRRLRRRWFLVLEAIAILLTVGSVWAGVSERFASEALTPIFRVLPSCAAAVATILPIAFFGSFNSGRRGRRSGR